MTISNYYWNQLNANEKRLYETLEKHESEKHFGGGSTNYTTQMDIYHKVKGEYTKN